MKKLLSAALGAPVTVLENAGEGGAFGMALLALAACKGVKDLEGFLNGIFAGVRRSTVSATDTQVAAFRKFLQAYQNALPLAQSASRYL